jgi:uncharacterized membrane protein YgaE (UPF0421/DUF939 family)
MDRELNALGAVTGVLATLVASGFNDPLATGIFAGITILCTYFAMTE